MAKTAKRINRRKLVTVQAYAIISLFILFGMVIGLVIGTLTAPTKTVTLTETIEVPSYSSDNLPEVEDIYYYDVPLSHSLQRFIYEVCADENVPVALAMFSPRTPKTRATIPLTRSESVTLPLIRTSDFLKVERTRIPPTTKRLSLSRSVSETIDFATIDYGTATIDFATMPPCLPGYPGCMGGSFYAKIRTKSPGFSDRHFCTLQR